MPSSGPVPDRLRARAAPVPPGFLEEDATAPAACAPITPPSELLLIQKAIGCSSLPKTVPIYTAFYFHGLDLRFPGSVYPGADTPDHLPYSPLWLPPTLASEL